MIAQLNDDGRRLDRILRKALPNISLSTIHKLLRTGKVLVNGKTSKAENRIAAGSIITIKNKNNIEHIPRQNTETETLSKYIVWIGEGLLVLNKPSGLEVHGEKSLETMVRTYLADKIPTSLSFRPGPLHRLDKPTSGLIVFSTSLEGAQYFSSLIQKGEVEKEYLALVDGRIENTILWEEGLVRDKKMRKTFIAKDSEVKSQSAQTLITPLLVSNSHSLIKAEILTGRTHQIRAHASFHGHPLSGDKKYGSSSKNFQRNKEQGFFLHAYMLSFYENKTRNLLTLKAPLPETFNKKIANIFGRTIS